MTLSKKELIVTLTALFFAASVGIGSVASPSASAGPGGASQHASAAPTPDVSDEEKAASTDLLGAAVSEREAGHIGLALELAGQATGKWPGNLDAVDFLTEAASQATGTAAAISAANDAPAQDHMGAANTYKQSAQRAPIMAAAAIEEYGEVLNLAPNRFTAAAQTEVAKLAPTATAAVQRYFVSATAQAAATSTALARNHQPTPIPFGVTGNNGVTGFGSGCGSSGGPGYRLPNGKCASWRDVR